MTLIIILSLSPDPISLLMLGPCVTHLWLLGKFRGRGQVGGSGNQGSCLEGEKGHWILDGRPPPVLFPILAQRESLDSAHYRRFVNSSNISSKTLAPSCPQ